MTNEGGGEIKYGHLLLDGTPIRPAIPIKPGKHPKEGGGDCDTCHGLGKILLSAGSIAHGGPTLIQEPCPDCQSEGGGNE